MIEAIAEYLASEFPLTIGQNLFIGFMPDEPLESAALYQYTGPEPELELGTGNVVEERLAIQVVFRGNNHQKISERTQAVFYALCSDKNEFKIIPQQSPFFLGWKDRRCSFVFNIRILK